MGSGTSKPGSASSRQSFGSDTAHKGHNDVHPNVTEDEIGLRPNIQWTEVYFSNQPASDPYGDDDVETVDDDDSDHETMAEQVDGDLQSEVQKAHSPSQPSKMPPLQVSRVDFHVSIIHSKKKKKSFEMV